MRVSRGEEKGAWYIPLTLITASRAQSHRLAQTEAELEAAALNEQPAFLAEGRGRVVYIFEGPLTNGKTGLLPGH